MGKFRTAKKINLAVQALNLKKVFPESRYFIRYNCLTWEADLTPSALSNTYTVRMKYKLKKRPDVSVVKPTLIVPDGETLPHTYSGKRLCLYYPKANEWRGDMLLVKTILPWISEWLLNYELWLATGKWCAGGIHP
jgi:hypothetical protein